MSNSLWPHGLWYTWLLCPSPSPGICPSSCPVNWWCHPTISSSAAPFSFCLQYFPASGSFPMNWLFASGGQSIGASASVLPMKIQSWFPLRLTGLISMWSLRVGHDWATSLSLFTFMQWRRTWQPTPVFLPGESQGLGSLVGCRLWGRTESDTTEVT